MTPKYKQFIFEHYQFDREKKTLELHYGYDGIIHFTEVYRFDFDFAAYDGGKLDRACQNLFFMAGVSYYKAYLAPEIIVNKGELDTAGAAFFSNTYQRGMGEFFYVNSLDPRTPITFPVTQDPVLPADDISEADGLLIGIGGGKDSLVSIEMLRGKSADLATWSVNHREQLTPQVQRIGLPHYWVERVFDKNLLDLNARGALNGHIPISGILACAGAIVAVLSGRRDVVVSNEHSANEPTLQYRGVAINHQYSKSQTFETEFQTYLAQTLGGTVRYYSLLRPLSELRIAELFAKLCFGKYSDVFSSCNRAFTFDQHHLFWDGSCPKCAFVFLILTPFIARDKLEALFGGKNLFTAAPARTNVSAIIGHRGR